MRRQPVNPYFSKQSVTKLEPAIRAVVENLCRRLCEFRELKEPVNIGHAYAALTLDIITDYCFAKSYGCINRPTFAPEWPAAIDATSKQSPLNKQFPSILKFFKMMPESVVGTYRSTGTRLSALPVMLGVAIAVAVSVCVPPVMSVTAESPMAARIPFAPDPAPSPP